MKVREEESAANRIYDEIAAGLTGLDGAATGIIRAFRRSYSQRLSNQPPELVSSVAFRLLSLSGFNPRFVAYELVQHHTPTLTNLTKADLEAFGRGLDNWAAADVFACYLAGPVWREGQVDDDVIKSWTHSPDRWWRRAALVSTVPLNNRARGGRGDPVRTLAICKLLSSDRDQMVVKAMSWALRELAKRDPEAVREFIVTHEKELASLVKREVNNKLATGLKTPKLPPRRV